MNISGWFYIEPYVHISTKGDGVLLYNTLNSAVIEDDHPRVVRLIKRLRSHRSLLVAKLTSKEVGDSKVAAFVRRAREAFFGDVLSESPVATPNSSTCGRVKIPHPWGGRDGVEVSTMIPASQRAPLLP